MSGSHSGCHGYKWRHTRPAMFAVRPERCWDLWEVGGEGKYRYCVIETWCVVCEMWAGVEETVEHRVYNATQNNQIIALWQLLLNVWFVIRNSKRIFDVRKTHEKYISPSMIGRWLTWKRKTLCYETYRVCHK